MELCPCGSTQTYAECCEPIIKSMRPAESAEMLMRARYSAFVKNEIDFILQTIHPEKKDQHDERTVRNWSQKSDWISFEIINTEKGGPTDDEGRVEFKATYRRKGIKEVHHEMATFKKQDGRWLFFDGQPPTQAQYKREQPKIGRNDPCPCGSGKKYKKCCAQ